MGNKKGRKVIWQPTPINIISQICFQVNRRKRGKDDSSSEAHLQSSKTSRGSYLEGDFSIFDKIFKFYLVTQPFKLL
jgi:hypothetical protein